METKGRLTTHVLDAALGRPAEGLVIDLVRIDGEQRTPLGSARTNRMAGSTSRCSAATPWLPAATSFSSMPAITSSAAARS